MTSITILEMDDDLVRLSGFEKLVPRNTGHQDFQRKDFVDVTLVCGDGQIQAQKQALWESSSVFKDMLKTQNNVKKLQITGVLVSEMENILNLVEYGETVLPRKSIAKTVKKGNILGFSGFDEEKLKLLKELPILSGECAHPEPDLEELVIETRKKPGSPDVKITLMRQTEAIKNEMDEKLSKTKIPKLGDTIAEETTKATGIGSNVNTEKCQLTFMDVMIRNSVTKQKEGEYQCNICRKLFASMSVMREHMESHFRELPGAEKVAMMSVQGGEQWRCLDCGRIDAGHHIREHVEIHVPGLQYKCPKCDANTKTKNSLRSHMTRVCPYATKKRDKKCNMCPYTTHDDTILYSHWNIKHGQMNKQFIK